jgi:hypothetical protein
MRLKCCSNLCWTTDPTSCLAQRKAPIMTTPSGAYTSTGKRKSSMTHARRTYTCLCGKECRGNGGWSSHKRACALWQGAIAQKRAAQDRPVSN